MKKSNKTRRMTNESTSIESIQRPETNTVSPPIFIDPAILRKSGLVDSSLELVDSWPLPSVIEISESGTCNRVCSFCPRSSPGYPDIKEFISPLLLQKLLEELAPYSYSGIFVFSGFVEPMLDKKIYQHIEMVRAYLPKAKIEMVTNGDVLTRDRLRLLFECGLSTLLISVYDGVEAAEKFTTMYEQEGLTNKQVVIRHRYLPETQNFGITLNNRAGMMESASFPIKSLIEPLEASCNYPHYTFFMDYQGDVLLCPHDWGKKLIVGNLNKQTFVDLWLSKAFQRARERLALGDRKFQPCATCDVHGSLIGGEHVVAWQTHSTKVLK